MFSDETRESFGEFLDNLDWDVRGQYVYLGTRTWEKAKKRLRFHGCRLPHAWEKDPHALRPYNLAPAASFPFSAMAAWSALPKKPATGTTHAFKPIPGVLWAADIDAAYQRVNELMHDKMDDLERNILDGGLL